MLRWSLQLIIVPDSQISLFALGQNLGFGISAGLHAVIIPNRDFAKGYFFNSERDLNPQGGPLRLFCID